MRQRRLRGPLLAAALVLASCDRSGSGAGTGAPTPRSEAGAPTVSIPTATGTEPEDAAPPPAKGASFPGATADCAFTVTPCAADAGAFCMDGAELVESCHRLGDPFAANDLDAHLAFADHGLTRPGDGGLVHDAPASYRAALEQAGGLRAHYGMPPSGPVQVRLLRDCRRCRRGFVSYELEVGGVRLQAMVEGGRLTELWRKRGE